MLHAVLFYREKDEKRFMRFLWLGVKIASVLTNVGMSHFTTTMAYDNLNKQTSTILAQKSVAVLSLEGQNTKSFEKASM